MSKSCDCGLSIDDIDHFFLQCTLYDELHQVLKQDITKVWEACESRGSLNLSVRLLLFHFAIDQLTYVERHDILSADSTTSRTLRHSYNILSSFHQ